MGIVLIDFKSRKPTEINSHNDLVKLLKHSNPLMIRFYKNQLEDLKIIYIGKGLEIVKNERRKL